ncbi:hypothetical protein E6Q11_02910 [Candidatus Dojkabacteria bacterium]|uniref:Uncharacterized protein n=1 Tax=Candidatus Dojkabacteria bacterium TaxID=2099670 RepID=A0A5C7J828_9BACT|nr:MAG: hypothetical protein E6Q11_02910 [Candidatus Dojkabacteria bacterium]
MLNKAIKQGKEHRRPYTGAKSFDRSCRNHGSCRYCLNNRTHRNNTRIEASKEALQEYRYDSKS